MRITVRSRETAWMVAILIACLGLTVCSDEKDDLAGTADKGPGGFIQGVISRFDEDKEDEKEETRKPASPVDNEKGGTPDKSETADSPSTPLIYTRKYYSYRSGKNKDPFQPLLQEGGEMDGVTLNTLTLTGILWDDMNSMAVMEDNRGKGYMMKVGDRIAGANLVAIRRDAAVFRVVEFGVVHNVVKELLGKEELPI